MAEIFFFSIGHLSSLHQEIIQTLTVVFKTCLVITLIICIRAILPRYRMTDLLVISWEVFVPLLLVVLLLIIYISVVDSSSILLSFWDDLNNFPKDTLVLLIIFSTFINSIITYIVNVLDKLYPIKAESIKSISITQSLVSEDATGIF